MTSFIGNDPVQMDALGERMLSEAELLENLRVSMTAILYDAGWEGADAADIRADWETTHAPALGSAGELLRNMSSVLFANAGAQREASAADGTSSPTLAGLRTSGAAPGDHKQELVDHWAQIAANKAGVDLSAWDPSKGAWGLEGTITSVYEYYGDLYLQNPYLQWAGMANMIGPSFAAGFFDLSTFRELADKFSNLPDGVTPIPGMRELANLSEAELRWYETTFLQMQKDIFMDQAVMHEAYLGGGLDAIRELRDAGVIDDATVHAWEQIDEGRRTNNMDLLAEGNTGLLLREQRDIIDGYYQQMYDHGVTGPAFTYLMTAIGEPSIPGANSFGDYKPITITMETPGPDRINVPDWLPGVPDDVDNPTEVDVHVRTPFPDGNLADFNSRWDYITNDTLPAYQDMLRNHPGEVHDIISSDVSGRIDDYRLHNRLDTILEHYFTDWGVDVDQ